MIVLYVTITLSLFSISYSLINDKISKIDEMINQIDLEVAPIKDNLSKVETQINTIISKNKQLDLKVTSFSSQLLITESETDIRVITNNYIDLISSKKSDLIDSEVTEINKQLDAISLNKPENDMNLYKNTTGNDLLSLKTRIDQILRRIKNLQDTFSVRMNEIRGLYEQLRSRLGEPDSFLNSLEANCRAKLIY